MGEQFHGLHANHEPKSSMVDNIRRVDYEKKLQLVYSFLHYEDLSPAI